MTYTPDYPSWYYSYLDIPNLEQIQKELIYVSENCVVSHNGELFYQYYRQNFIQYTPTLNEYLKQLGLYDKLHKSLFPMPNKEHTIHVDAYDKHIKYSLNIPLLDYSGTYTAWYDVPVIFAEQKKRPGQLSNDLLRVPAVATDQNAEPTHLAEITGPMLINTTIPHRRITLNKKRLMCTLKFWPELTLEEVNRLGVKLEK